MKIIISNQSEDNPRKGHHAIYILAITKTKTKMGVQYQCPQNCLPLVVRQGLVLCCRRNVNKKF